MFYKTFQCLILVLNFWTSPRQRVELTHPIFCTLHNNFDDFFFVEEQAPNDPAIRFPCTFIVRLPIYLFIVLPQPSLEFDKPWIPVSHRLAFSSFLCPLTRAAQFSQANIAFGNPDFLKLFREDLDMLPELGVYARLGTLTSHHVIFHLSVSR